jgi:hypothetical protein
MLGRVLFLWELLRLERSLKIQTLHEVIQNSRVWIGGAIQDTQSHQGFISLKLLLGIVGILSLLQRLRMIYLFR